jgi:hypothetical protein
VYTGDVKRDLFTQARQLLVKGLFFLIPTQLGYHFWPEWAFVLGRRIDYLSPTLFFTDVLVLAIIILSLAQVGRSLLNASKNQLFWLVILVVVMNLVFSVRPKVTIYYLIKLVEMVALGVILSKQNSLPWKYFLAGVLINGLLGLFQVVSGHTIGGIFWLLGERTFTADTPGIALHSPLSFSGGSMNLRAYGATAHPNILGSLITMAMLLLLGDGIIFLQSRLRLTVMILLAVGLWATGSRMAFLSLLAGLGVLIFKTIYRRPLIPLIFLSTVGIIFWLTAHSPRNKFTIFERAGQFTVAGKLFVSRPLLGTGLGTYPAAAPSVTRSREGNIFQPVHNIFALYLVETGLLGASMSFFLFLKVRNRIRYDTPLFWALLVMALGDHFLYTIQTGQLLTVAILASSIFKLKDSKS